LSRESATDVVKRHGGKVTGAPSSKTSFVVVGDNPGPSKMTKIKTLQLQILNEDQFYDLINSTKEDMKSDVKSVQESNPVQETKSIKEIKLVKEIKSENVSATVGGKPQSVPVIPISLGTSNSIKGKAPISLNSNSPVELWTEKYKPTTYGEIIGNKTNVDKLIAWLKGWNTFLKAGFPKGGKDDISQYRAVLLSGPPGIGKTTTAHMVAKMEGYEAIEFNASDTRSKKSLEVIECLYRILFWKQHIAEAL
jgi:replication factor C subunit 1